MSWIQETTKQPVLELMKQVLNYSNKYKANPATAIWANVIKMEAVCSSKNLRLCLLSAAKFIAGIRTKLVGIVVIAMMKINKKASKFIKTRMNEAIVATLIT